MNLRSLIVLLVFTVASVVTANSAIQTDWSGGPGVPGPVSPFGSTFDTSMSMDFDTSPGTLTLSLPYGEHYVDHLVGPNSIVFADINGDGIEDIACASTEGVWWWENLDGIGFNWQIHQVNQNGVAVSWLSAADFDNDGDLDLCASYYQDGLYWWENSSNGTSWAETQIMSANVRGSCVADIDSDGWDDIVLAVWGTSDIMWWRNKLGSSHNWSANFIDGTFTGAYTVDAMDMNGNGRPDVVAGSGSGGQVAVFVNNGGSWDKDVVVASYADERDLAIADLNGDGYYDILSANAASVVWWKNINWTHWEMNIITDTPNSPYAVAATDLNNDGNTDVLALNYGSSNGAIYWLENDDGTGMSWTQVDAFQSRLSYDIAVGDVNGDGIPEFGTASYQGWDTVQYFRIGGYDTPGTIVSSINDTGAIDDINWDYLHWDSEEPSGTDIQVQIRGSNDAGNMGPWSAWLTGPTSLAGLLESTDRYIQYKMSFTTSNPWIAPKLHDITFLWSVTGISIDPTPTDPLVLLGPNPVHGSFQLGFHLPSAGQADLRIYDLSGREVVVPVSGFMESGSHSTTVTGLPSGLYVCTYSAPETQAQLQIVVVN